MYVSIPDDNLGTLDKPGGTIFRPRIHVVVYYNMTFHEHDYFYTMPPLRSNRRDVVSTATTWELLNSHFDNTEIRRTQDARIVIRCNPLIHVADLRQHIARWNNSSDADSQHWELLFRDDAYTTA